MSRSFSKRNSLLPSQTAKELEAALAAETKENMKEEKRKERRKKSKDEEGYDRKLHAYAIRMLAELEDAQKEVSRVEHLKREFGLT